MGVFIALLRGINVAGQKKVPMLELKTLFHEAGFTNVVTYIQSGNVVFSTSIEDENKIAFIIEQKIKSYFGFDVPVMVYEHEYFKMVISENPFKNINLERLYVVFLEKTPEKSLLYNILIPNHLPDEFIIFGNTVYLHVPIAYGNSKLSNNFFESKLKVKATTRNWRSVNELYKIALSI